jgi:hypothetical protein
MLGYIILLYILWCWLLCVKPIFHRGCAEVLQSACVCGKSTCGETTQSKCHIQRSVQFTRKLLPYKVKSSATSSCQAKVKRCKN